MPEKADIGYARYRKVKGIENPADLMTKWLTGNPITKYMEEISLEGGRTYLEFNGAVFNRQNHLVVNH